MIKHILLIAGLAFMAPACSDDDQQAEEAIQQDQEGEEGAWLVQPPAASWPVPRPGCRGNAAPVRPARAQDQCAGATEAVRVDAVSRR